MVSALSEKDKAFIAQAIAEAEKKTSVELRVVVARASGDYQGFFLLYGLITGTALALGAWEAALIHYLPVAFALQLSVTALFPTLSPLRNLCLRLVPKRILQHHAAHRAWLEFLHAERQAKEKPLLLCYISLAEHYAHLFPNTPLHALIPDEAWQKTMTDFISETRNAGFRQACLFLIHELGRKTAQVFPGQE